MVAGTEEGDGMEVSHRVYVAWIAFHFNDISKKCFHTIVQTIWWNDVMATVIKTIACNWTLSMAIFFFAILSLTHTHRFTSGSGVQCHKTVYQFTISHTANWIWRLHSLHRRCHCRIVYLFIFGFGIGRQRTFIHIHTLTQYTKCSTWSNGVKI